MSPQHILSLALAAALAPMALAQITPGHLVVVRVGDGAAALGSAATAAFLEEFTVAGTPVQTIALPTTASLPNRQATVSGSATSEGTLTQSTDGNYLVCVGYAQDAGVAGSVVSTTSAATPRVIARIALGGTIDTTTSLDNQFSAGNIRSASTEDGTQFWAAGSNSGVVLAPYAGTSGTALNTGTVNLRVVGIANGQLFTTSGSGATTHCVNTVGSGVPTTSGQTIDPLNGMASGTASPYDYWFADASTVYVADDRSAASSGGLQKWTESGGLWTLAYTLVPGPGNVTCRGLSGIVDQTGTTLFATTTESNANRLVSVVDTGVGSTFTTLATAATNTAFRGVRFVRNPRSVSFAGVGCTTSVGIPTVGTQGGAPVAGNLTFALTCGNAPAFTPYVAIVGVNQMLIPGGVSVTGFGAPACAVLYSPLDALVSNATDGAGNGVIPLGLPYDTSYWGLPFTVQNAVYEPAFYPGLDLPFGLSDGMQVIVGN